VSVLPDPASAFGARVRERLATEEVIWLTIVPPSGTPQPNPVWFVFEPESESLLIYNDNRARRLAHIDAHPRVAAHFNSDAEGDDVVVFTGRLEQAPDAPGPDKNDAYIEKYTAPIERIGFDNASFAERYSVPMRLHIDKVRG
jgi:PPOX class probable F420-dependent enzyme